jgi:hypothetical protein
MRARLPIGVLLTMSLLAACAGGSHVRSAARDDNDDAYLLLRAKDEGCPTEQRASCCAELHGALTSALEAGDMMSAAGALDALAITCPAHRPAAIAALAHAPKPIEGATPGTTVGVQYRIRLAESDRIYWVGAFVDGRYTLGEPLPPGRHDVEVAMHVMTVAGIGQDALVRLAARKTVEIAAGESALLIATLERKPGAQDPPFDLRLQAVPKAADKPLTADAAQVKAAVKDEPPARIDKAYVKRYGTPRLPAEFGGLRTTSLNKVCVESGGSVESISPLVPRTHPRLVAAVLDFVSRAEYEPYRLNGRPLPFCFVLAVNMN